MPEKKTIAKARKDAQEGKSPSTQAGEFIKQEMEHIRQGRHGARSARQAIAIGLSEARRAGVKLAAPKKGRASESTRHKAEKDLERGKRKSASKPSAKRSSATKKALKREPAKQAARKRKDHPSEKVA